jgi:hypothetical protein
MHKSDEVEEFIPPGESGMGLVVNDEAMAIHDSLARSVATLDGSSSEDSLNLFIAEMHIQVPADIHLTLVPEIDASCKVEQGMALVKESIEVSNETFTKENHCGYKKYFSSPKHALEHAKHEIDVCDDTDLRKGGSVSDPVVMLPTMDQILVRFPSFLK